MITEATLTAGPDVRAAAEILVYGHGLLAAGVACTLMLQPRIDAAQRAGRWLLGGMLVCWAALFLAVFLQLSGGPSSGLPGAEMASAAGAERLPLLVSAPAIIFGPLLLAAPFVVRMGKGRKLLRHSLWGYVIWAAGILPFVYLRWLFRTV